MFTQCPSCSTIYEVHAADLAVAQGQVRCGTCATTFNALSYLTEEAPANAKTLTGLTAEEVAELAAADDASPAEAEESAPPDENDGDGASGAAAIAAEFLEGDGAPAAGEEERQPPAGEEAPVAATDTPLQDAAQTETQVEPTETIAAAEPTVEEPVAEAPGVADAERPAETDGALDIEALLAPPRRRGRGLWTAAACLLALALVAQIVHHMRAQLVLDPHVGPALERIYGALGLDVEPDWDVTRYEIVRRPEMAAADPGRGDVPGTLRLVAFFANGAEHPQPYPLLRVTLEDRWGGAVARREFEPREYLSAGHAPDLLPPGERTRAELVLVDPGVESVGYTLDLCLREDGALRCANDAR